MPLTDLEDGEPEEADADGGDADDRGAEEEEDEEQEEDVVDGEDLGGLDEDPVQRLEDVDVSEDVAAAGFADGVLGLVDARDEHTGEDEEGEHHQDKTADEFERAEDGLDLDPGLDEPVAVFAARFGSETFAADQCAFLADQGFQFTSVARVQSTVTALTAALELALALAVGLQLRGSIGG